MKYGSECEWWPAPLWNIVRLLNLFWFSTEMLSPYCSKARPNVSSSPENYQIKILKTFSCTFFILSSKLNIASSISVQICLYHSLWHFYKLEVSLYPSILTSSPMLVACVHTVFDAIILLNDRVHLHQQKQHLRTCTASRQLS